MDVMFISKLKKPRDMDEQTFFGAWLTEAQAAIAALDANRMKVMYKIAGEYRLIGIITVENPEQIDLVIHNLPIWTSGCMDIVESYEWFILSDYRSWAKQLENLAKRGSNAEGVP